MVEADRAVKFISKLVQLTQSKLIEWDSITAPDDKLSAAFVADLEGRRIRIRKYSKEYPNPEYERYTQSPAIAAFIVSGREPPKTVLRSGIILEVLNNKGLPIYNFDNKTGLSDLLETASYSSAKIDDLMESVLSR
ncbi:MAG: hypothetical protein E5Y12_10060 [Mesorhizobium sp.]|nr:MAG: hypothetical protein E5Y12_10060 [Mesorhizobium sp.]